MTAFLSYGAFWWWFALLLLFAGNGVIDLSAAGPTVGVALLLWGVFTLYMWIGTFRLPKILFLIFLTLWVTFLLLGLGAAMGRSEEHTSELQSLMRISYAVFCLKNKNRNETYRIRCQTTQQTTIA